MPSAAMPSSTATARAFVPPPRPALVALPGGLLADASATAPLQLGRHMRQRLRAAVHALLAPHLSDTARLLRIVTAAKARHADGCVTATRVPELARWLGVGCSTVDKALAELRGAGAMETHEQRVRGAVVGLTCTVPGLTAASVPGRDPLALTRAELATLLRLVEKLFAPGWLHRDGSRTPAGLLAERTGRGAATDRLALLLIVLDARPSGRVRLCGGAVDTRVGRPATTVSRLLGATAYQGARILARLHRAGVVVLERRSTGSGLAGRGEIRIPAVAAAHGSPAGPPHEGRPQIADHAAAADSYQRADLSEKHQVTPDAVAECEEVPEHDAAADLHTHHAQVVAQGVMRAGEFLVSGEAAYGVLTDAGGARGRATTVPPDRRQADAGAHGAVPDALRAEKEHPIRGDAKVEGPLTGRPGADTTGLRRRQRIALRPVRRLVDSLPPGRRAVALRAVDVVLRNVSPEDLAERLNARFALMSLEGPPGDRGVIRDPLAWLLSQLPTITLCGTCGVHTTTGAPSARTARCDWCTSAMSVREAGMRACPCCGRSAYLGQSGQCGQCDHRQDLDASQSRAAAAAAVRCPGKPQAVDQARREVSEAARTAARDAARRGADPLVQDLAARLAAHQAASTWASAPGGPGAGRLSEDQGQDQGSGPIRWSCANPGCSRQSTAAAPASRMCSTCDRGRQLREVREARHLRLAEAGTAS